MKYYENQQKFFQLQILQHVNVTVFNSCISEKFFHQTFLDTNTIYERSKYLCWFIYYLAMACENI